MYRYSILLFIIFSFQCYSSTINLKLVGNKIIWSDANIIGDVVTQSTWSNSTSLSLLPVKEWTPGFIKHKKSEIVFNNTLTSERVTSNFEHKALNFRFKNSNVEFKNQSKRNCSKTDLHAGIISLENSSDSLCLAEKSIYYSSYATEPFEFYNSSFKFDSIINSFLNAHVSAGVYVAEFNYDLAYTSVLNNGIHTYNYYPADTVVFRIDYQPAYIDSVSVIGTGEFSLDYDKINHSVSGNSEYLINVNGYIDPGLLLTFRSSGVNNKEFKLKHYKEGFSVPYSLSCPQCDTPEIIENGTLTGDNSSRIKFSGDSLTFNLIFDFDNQTIIEPGITDSGSIIPGEYYDTVSMLIELDI